MAADLPPGRWSALLVGAWWPARPDAPMAGVTYWRQAGELKRNEASDLQNERSQLSRNRGRTADDLLERYWRGEQRLATIAHQCEVKSDQSDRVADAVNYLRDRLTEIAQSGNQQIDQILAGKGPIEAKVAAANLVIEQSNAMADSAGATAMSNIIDATQRVLDETIGGGARSWLRDHGVNLDSPPRPRPITAEDLDSRSAGPPPEASAFGGDRSPPPAPPAADDVPEISPAALTYGSDRRPPPAPSPVDGVPEISPAGLAYGSDRRLVPWPSPSPVSPPLPPGAPSVSVGGPSLPAGMPSAAAPTAPISPQSLSQSFATGMMAGAPAAAGGESLSAGAVHAASEPLAPAVSPAAAPVVPAPTVAAGVAGVAHIPDSAAAPGPAPVAPPTADSASGMTTVAPVMTGGPAGSPAPVAAAPAGPLPAYGSDLRPPVVAPPAAPPAPAGPVSGAAVAPSSPAAGASVMSPVDRSATQATPPSPPASGASPTASAAAPATAGAAAGDTSRRAAEQQRLRRILDAVARQEPRLSWAAGLRDDGRTTLLVTDLAGGWIPPHVRLPTHVTLLEPTTRRRDANVIDLLGAVTLAASHHPHGYLGEPDPDTPALTADRRARIAPKIAELGPTLAEAVRRRDGLPRIAHAVAVAATRNYGVPDNEADLLHHKATQIRQFTAVADWMLLAAINALIAGDQSGANYHLAWAIAAMSTRRST
ncbi:DUF5632 domain-containing protein [Mycobacterium shinjukuense]|uniref:DUF5632 domain-containing protein n=1 Tax=Mycobacterium shinjukuense TaxID=398694 RepID=UPI0021F37E30|nr:DUF5632 domain-containing protein [Mycobacterium shinjukuense]MCV6984822.1 DUF5632 domain-containing protein [Mycobacterium shinjukuense]